MQKKDDITDREDRALSAFFEAARAEEPGPSQDLLARVLADAGDVAAGFSEQVPAKTVTAAAPRTARFADLFAGLGGLAGAGVMTASVMIGAYLGYAAPEDLVTLSQVAGGTDIPQDLDAEIAEFNTADFSLFESDILP